MPLVLPRITRLLRPVGERRLIAAQLPQSVGVAVGEVGRDIDPLPAFGADRLGLFAELLGHQHVEKADILQPAAVIALEQIAQDHATGFRSEEHTSELKSLMRISYAVFCLKTKK